MSLLTDGLHKTVLEGSIWPGPRIIYDILYETHTSYGEPIHIQKVYQETESKVPEPKDGSVKNAIPMGDEHRHAMFSNLHKLLSGQLTLTENRKLLTDRPSR